MTANSLPAPASLEADWIFLRGRLKSLTKQVRWIFELKFTRLVCKHRLPTCLTAQLLALTGVSALSAATLTYNSSAPSADSQSADSQNWTVTALGNGQYSLIDYFSGRAADVYGVSTGNGANICLWNYWGGNNQKYTFTATDSNFFRLTPVHSGKSIDVNAASTADGANVIQWQYTGAANQQWKFTAASTVRRLRPSTTTNQYIRHAGYRAYIATAPYPAQDSEFRVVPGLANGVTGVSFESINFPGRYLCVRSDGTVWIDTAEGTSAYNESATFRRVSGLSDSSLYSYQMWTDSSRYLINESGAINANTVADGNEANATFEEVFPAPGY